MPHLISKIFLGFILTIVLAFGLGSATYAGVDPGGGGAGDPAYTATCTELENPTGVWNNAPSPMAIICPIVRLLNVFVLSAGAFFVIFIFVAAIKYALAQGDPKALQGSQQTLTTAVIGFLIVIGVYTIVVIIKNVLGLQDNPILDPFGSLSKNLAELLGKFGITWRL